MSDSQPAMARLLWPGDLTHFACLTSISSSHAAFLFGNVQAAIRLPSIRAGICWQLDSFDLVYELLPPVDRLLLRIIKLRWGAFLPGRLLLLS